MTGIMPKERGHGQRVGYLAVALVVLGLVALVYATPAHAATFTVDRSDDPNLTTTPTAGDCTDATANDCSLRGAIMKANATSGFDKIAFLIPDDGAPGFEVKTISPTAASTTIALPSITEAVEIDGYTQPGSAPNTENNPGETNAVLKIELSGASAGSFKKGLRIDAPGVVVRGLVINRFSEDGIFVSDFSDSGGPGATIEGNFIGTNPAGTSDQGNGQEGVQVLGGDNNQIGGTDPLARNLISGNGLEGVTLWTNANKVEGNLIGTTADGNGDLGNTGSGVDVFGGSNNIIGGTTDSAANTIAFNDGKGVAVSGTGNSILSNSIHSSGQLGIDLGKDGVTPNDRKDRDTGINNLQNYPVKISARVIGSSTVIEGTLNSRPRKTFTIQFFASSQADPSGFGEGETFIGETTVKTNREGKRNFSFDATGDYAGQVITATATNDFTGDTSEFSKATEATYSQ